jgi:hypothetical protein
LSLGRSGGRFVGITILGIASPTQHDHVVGNNFNRRSLIAVLIFPLTALNATFYEYLLSFAQVFPTDFSETTPRNDAMPFGPFLIVSVLIAPSLGGGQRKSGYGFAGCGISHFRISSDVAQQ